MVRQPKVNLGKSKVNQKNFKFENKKSKKIKIKKLIFEMFQSLGKISPPRKLKNLSKSLKKNNGNNNVITHKMMNSYK